jgi:hypothetical protein
MDEMFFFVLNYSLLEEVSDEFCDLMSIAPCTKSSTIFIF